MSEQFDPLMKLLTMPRAFVEKEYSQYFYYYFRWCYESRRHAEDFILRWKYLFENLNVKDKIVLDIGSGFGINSLICALSGAREVVCVEHNAEKIAVFKKILKLFNVPAFRLSITAGSAEKLPIKNGRADLALFNDALSHVGDFKTSLEEAARILKHDGRLFIEDGNNPWNLRGRWKQHKYRKMWEIGPVDPDVVRGTDQPVAYRDVRKQIIKGMAPHLEEKKIHEIARKTAGLTESEIGEVMRVYGETNRLPAIAAPFKYRHPLTGECLERSFSPFLLKRYLKKLGFEAEILPPAMSPNFQGMKGRVKRIVIFLHQKLPWIMVPFFSEYRIVGIKGGDHRVGTLSETR
jgi:ubiquinone/menaquinone biosynthesis C-methylase UbiE